VIISFILKINSFTSNINNKKLETTKKNNTCKATTIYLDNNGTTKIYNESLELMEYIYKHYYGNPSGIYKLGSQSKKLLEISRNRLAKMLKCEPSEIFFTCGATESNNIAIRGIYAKHRDNGNHIVTSSIEHPSVCETVKSLHDAKVTFLPVDKYGRIDLLELENAIRQDTVLVTIIMGNNEIGTIQDIKGISQICTRKKVHFHCDMTQIIGKYSVNMHDLGIDSATGSGHKFHSPKATGFLYLKDGSACESCMTGGHQEKSIRSGTENIPGIVAMTYSLYICYSLLNKGAEKQIKEMRDYMQITLVHNIPNCIVNGSPEHQMYNTLSMCLPVNSRKLINMLDKNNIAINTGSACSKGKTSSVLDAIGLTPKQQEGSIRISLGFLNTMDDCKTAVQYIIHYYNILANKQHTT
jgi:cysteine desulfurase